MTKAKAPDEHRVEFASIDPATLSTTQVRTMKQSDIAKCPFTIFVPSHYRADGSCMCSNAAHRKLMIREWGYRPAQFKNIPLVD